jgi:hypothetical protein
MNRYNLRALRFFVVDFHSFLGVAHFDMNDSSKFYKSSIFNFTSAFFHAFSNSTLA